jgi:hypothetical protein
VLCERESHILFAEIMLAGRSKPADMYEIVTGLREMNKEEDRLPQNLVFHQVVVGQGGMDGRKDASTAGVPLKTIILATANRSTGMRRFLHFHRFSTYYFSRKYALPSHS